MATIIAHTAVVDPRAELDDDVRVGHHCVIGPHVKIGRGTRLENNVTLTGHTVVGRNNHMFPGVVIGAEPQDLSYQGSPTQVIIGDGNVLRESVTINRATEKSAGDKLVTDSHFDGSCSIRRIYEWHSEPAKTADAAAARAKRRQEIADAVRAVVPWSLVERALGGVSP